MKRVVDSYIGIYQGHFNPKLNAGFVYCLAPWLSLTLLSLSLASLWLTPHESFQWLHVKFQLLPNEFWSIVTIFGDTRVALCVILFFSWHFPRLLQALFISSLIATFFTTLGKELLLIDRPPAIIHDEWLHVVGPFLLEKSFPSGHSTTAMTMCLLLLPTVTKKWQRAVIIGVAILVCLSRVACGVHWPEDVLAGASVGLISGWIGLYLANRLPLSWPVIILVFLILLTNNFQLWWYNAGYPNLQVGLRVLVMISSLYLLCIPLYIKSSKYN